MRMLYLPSFLLLFSCSSEEKDPDTTATDDSTSSTDNTTDQSTDDTTTTTTSTATETETEAMMQFSGKVAYDDGSQISNESVRVQMCSSSCIRGNLESDGSFNFPSLRAGTYALDVVPLLGYNYATALDFVEISEEIGDVTWDSTVTIYTYSNETTLEAGSFDAGGGLSIQLDPNHYTKPLGAEDGLPISALSVAPSETGLQFDHITGDILKIWYLGPFDAEVEWSFEINDLELEDGTELQLYNGSYGNLEWTDLGTVTVQNGTIQSNPDKPLGVLTSLVLVQN